MKEYVSNDEMIIIIRGISIVGSFLTANIDLATLIVTGLIGFLGGKAIK